VRKLLSLGLFVPSLVVAAPFVTTDPTSVTGITQCGVYLDFAAKVTIPVTAVTGGNICKFDVANVSTGNHSIQMTFITVNDPIWGSLESAKSLPLSFTRPSVPVAPSGLGLTAQ
jgi:hypothetical protein